MSATRRFRIATIPADGVGQEVVAAGREVLDALAAGSGGAFALDHLGQPEQAARLNAAIEATTAAGIVTRDLGGAASTEDVTKALIDALNR
jgi:tartrate dehydrogenase/decarboxylase / D-malate dehydrogenase